MGGEPCASERSAKAAGEGRTLEGRRGVGGERRRGSQAKGRMARGARVHETGGCARGVFAEKRKKEILGDAVAKHGFRDGNQLIYQL